ncbi:Pup--protein ligase [Galactobacter valiniphilus]|uniref:Pup--protein ligase n=1 Tax=Galactobacter valiniphilus TaxID=2676122 RepID=UPI00373662CD
MITRVIGLETEYGLAYDAGPTRPQTTEEVARRLFAPVVEWGRSTNVFLLNGSRLYLDVGSHPEVATAECVDPLELLEQDRAGVLTLARLVSTAEDSLRSEGLEGKIHLFRNNVDSAGNSFGCHENYLIPRRLEYRRLTEQLLPFLVTRQLLSGAGHVAKTEDGPRLVLSQRAEHMWEGVSASSTRSRPMINTRDEPHADAERFRRLHVIVGDTNMAEGSTLLKTVSTSLVLSLLETARVMPSWAIANPVKALRDISRDATGSTLVTLADGRTVTALQIQEYFLEAASAHAAAEGIAEGLVAEVLGLWRLTLDAWAGGDLDAVNGTLDFAAKRELLTRYAERQGLALDDPRVARLELAYHDVAPEAGLRESLEARGLLRRFTDPARVEAAQDTPPSGTRAQLRSRFLAAARGAGVEHQVDWLHLKLTQDPGRTVLLPDPFATSDAAAEALIDELLG